MMPTKRNCRVSIKKEVIKKSMVTKLKLVLLVLGLGGCTSKVNGLFGWKIWRRDRWRRRGKSGEQETRKFGNKRKIVTDKGVDTRVYTRFLRSSFLYIQDMNKINKYL